MSKNDSTINPLIRVNPESVQGLTNTVEARDMHGFLGINTRWDTWINRRIQEYGFVQGIDFVTLKNDHQEYQYFALSLSMAKEIAMVERTPKGRQARLYFIECERRLQQQEVPTDALVNQLLDNPEAIGRMLIEYAKTKKELAVAQPKVDFYDEVAKQEGELTIREANKLLFGRSVKEWKLAAWLKDQGWLCKTSKGREPTAYAMDRGYMRPREDYIPGLRHTVPVAVITGKGLTLLRHLIRTGDLFLADVDPATLLPQPRQSV